MIQRTRCFAVASMMVKIFAMYRWIGSGLGVDRVREKKIKKKYSASVMATRKPLPSTPSKLASPTALLHIEYRNPGSLAIVYS